MGQTSNRSSGPEIAVEMHKFIVNNRIRSDPLPASSGTNNGHMNAMLKLKIALPLLVGSGGGGSPSAAVPSSPSSIASSRCTQSTNSSRGKSISSTTSSSAASSKCSSTSSNQNHLFKPVISPPSGTVKTCPDPTTATDDRAAARNTIKMSGYLKKKRNRVGGWRKLWFVLQNQLLLSYSSKEDYERRLAPFKDLINLVPGTLIKPAAGARFTIETTANVVYTFRCDNNKVCSEWITAICDCLGIKSRRRSIPSLTSQKWSLNRVPTKHGAKIPKLPMAKNTARIFQKGIIYEPIDHIAKVQQDFRLHQVDVPLEHRKQSTDVCRINRMFVVQQSANSKETVASKKSSSAVDSSGKVSHLYHRGSGAGNIKVGALKGRKMETLTECDDIEEQMQCITLEDTSLLSIPQEDSIEEHAAVTDFKQIAMNGASPTDSTATTFSSSFTSSSSSGSSTVSSSTANGEPIYAVIDLREKYQRRLNKQAEHPLNHPHHHLDQEFSRADKISNEGGGGRANGSANTGDGKSPSSNESSGGGGGVMKRTGTESGGDNDQNNNSVDTVDGAPGTTMGMHQGRPKSYQMYSSADYEEVQHFSNMKFSEPNSSADDEEEENIYEPINIPEELLNRSHTGHKNLWSYFPKINFDAILEMGRRRHHSNSTINGTSSSAASSLAATNPSSEFGAAAAAVTTSIESRPTKRPLYGSMSGSSSVSSASSSSGFSEMRKKLGSHRKSIKNRMKRMYTRANTAPPNLLNHEAASDELPSPAPITAPNNDNDLPDRLSPPPTGPTDVDDKSVTVISPSPPPLLPPARPVVNNGPKRDRNIFTSLSRLRKTRACIGHSEDNFVVSAVASKSKRFFMIPTGGAATTKMTADKEEPKKRNLDDGEENTRNVCHSTFYD